MARGQPKRPAPVSGPGAQSRRTDGGAGSKGQPLRVPTGGDYGDAKNLEEQQKAAPLATTSPGLPAGPPNSGGGGALTPGPEGVFGPTQNPGTPLNAGLPQPGQPSPLDGETLVRILFEKYPSEYLARLMENGQPQRPV